MISPFRRLAISIGGGGGAAKLAFPTANADIVQVSSIDTIATSGTAINAVASPGMNIISLYKPERIRQTCNITHLSVYCGNGAPFTNAKLQIWRKDGVTYDKVAEEELKTLLSASTTNNVALPTSIAVQEGDFIAWSVIGSSVFTASVVAAANSMRYTVSETPTDTDYAWESKTGLALKYSTHCKSSAPLIVGIGDSIMECYGQTTSMIDSANALFAQTKSWFYKLKVLDSRFSFQNAGAPAESTTMIEGRFNRDVVLIKPRFVTINGGVNDINTSVAKSVFLAKWTAMLDACVTSNIIPVVWKIMPWTNGTNVQMQTRDEWNADLATLFNTYNIPGKIIIDWDIDLGKNRVGGDVSNLWDIKTEYNNDGVHLNEAGQAKIAEVMLREIGKIFKL